MRLFRPRKIATWGGLALATALVSGALAGEARAQTEVPVPRLGPERGRWAATALDFAPVEPAVGPSLARSLAFERRFERDFGLAGPAGAPSTGDALMDRLARAIDTRWGDTTVYGWVERGLFLYARVKSMTEMERNGFNMEVEVDDVARGKLGVRVDRALD